MKLINIFASKSPDSKITVTAAMDSSQNKSKNIFKNPQKSFSNGGDLPVLDLKFCMYYLFPNSKYDLK